MIHTSTSPAVALACRVICAIQTRQMSGITKALTVLGALLGATVSGIDKSAGENNFAAMAEQYFNSKNGLNLVQNHPSVKTGSTYWYELYPQVLFDCLADRYPKLDRLSDAMRLSSDRWNDAYKTLAATSDGLAFDHTAFDFATMKPVYNGKWREPDAAAAIGWIQYASYHKFGDDKYLAAADGCIKALSSRQTNPAYEIMLPSGAYTAAHMNAELGRNYNVNQIVQWCFEPSTNRSGWGVIVGTWGGRPCSGMIGSTTDGGGYGFVMNTFASAASLVRWFATMRLRPRDRQMDVERREHRATLLPRRASSRHAIQPRLEERPGKRHRL